MAQQMEKPSSGWQRRLHHLSNGARLFFKGLISSNIWKSESPLRMRGSKVAVLSEVNIHSAHPSDISQLNHQGLYWWDSEQIDALTWIQIRSLSEPQLEALVCNPNTTGDQIAELIQALAHPAHTPKIAVLMRGLQSDPLEMAKIAVIADVVLHEMSPVDAKRVLIVLCRGASDRQLRAILHSMPFHLLKKFAEEELNTMDWNELNRLDLRVEDRQMQNSAELLSLAKGVECIDAAFADVVADTKFTIDPKTCPWNRVDHRKVSELSALLENDIDDERALERVNELLTEMQAELTQRQAHLHMLNNRFSLLPEIWEEHYLEHYRSHVEMLSRVVAPQYSVLDQMAKMLIRKSGEKLTEEERGALLETFDKGSMLADLIAPHVRRTRTYLHQLARELEFLEKHRDIFFDTIRHETRVGRFCVEVFWRMIHLGYDSESYPLLHGELFEDLVVKHSNFDQASRMLQQLHNYGNELEELSDRLQQYIDKLRVEELGERLRGQRLQLLGKQKDLE